MDSGGSVCSIADQRERKQKNYALSEPQAGRQSAWGSFQRCSDATSRQPRGCGAARLDFNLGERGRHFPLERHAKLARGTEDKEHAMSQSLNSEVAVTGIDIGKNSFLIVGLDGRGAMVPRQMWSRAGRSGSPIWRRA